MKWGKECDVEQQLAALCEWQGLDTAMAVLREEVDRTWAAYVSKQPGSLQEEKDSVHDPRLADDGWRCILAFLASGSGLLTAPIDVQSLIGADKDNSGKAWTPFTRLFASDPEAGERLLQRGNPKRLLGKAEAASFVFE